MARRKVSVELALEVARAILAAGNAAAAYRTLKGTIHELGDEADDTGRDMDQLAANTDIAARRVDELGDEAVGTIAALTLLDARINTVRASVHQLGLEFARTGDAAAGKELSRERSMLGKLTRLRKELSPDDAIPGLVEGLMHNIGALPSQLRGAGWLGAIVFGGAALPALSATVAGAVLGGVGAGGVVGGAFLAAQDQRVKTAWGILGDQIKADLAETGEALAPTYAKAAVTASQAWKQSGINEYLHRMGELVDPLAAGAGGFGVGIGRGLLGSVSGQLLAARELRQELPETGDAVADMLIAWSDAGHAAALGLGDTLDVIQALIRQGGHFTAGLAELYALTRNPAIGPTVEILGPGLLSSVPRMAGDIVRGVGQRFGNYKVIAEGMTGVGDAAEEMGRKAWTAAIRMTGLGRASDALHRTFLGFAGAEIDVEDALDRLGEALDLSNGSIDVHNENSRLARQILLQFAQAAQEAGARKFEETGSVERASQVYEHYRQELINTFRQAGYTRREAERLAAAWLAVPATVATKVTVEYEELNQPPRWLATGDVQVYGGRHLAGMEGRAAGGPVWPGRPYAINEHLHGGRPVETVTFGAVGMVSPASLTPMSAMGGASIVLSVQPGAESALTRAVVEILSEHVRASGGDSRALGIRR
ncbi:MAG TPA: hypothetical protein VF163_21495 [Micromonosporaceae bacterium]